MEDTGEGVYLHFLIFFFLSRLTPLTGYGLPAGRVAGF
jgi:hypothetical protein